METYIPVGERTLQAFSQPLVHSNAILNAPPHQPFTSKRQPTGQDWERYRQIITQLYQTEKRSLKEVMALMSTRHNFTATQRMYKKRIFDWDIRRHLRWAEREAVCQEMRQGQLSGLTNATVVVRGQERHLALFLRHMRQKEIMKQRNLGSGKPDRELDEVEGKMDKPSSSRDIVQHMWAMGTDVGPSLDAVGEERTCELICHATVTMWRESPTLPSTQWHLNNILAAAKQMAEVRRYRDARVLINQAGEFYHKQLRQSPVSLILSLLDCTDLINCKLIQHLDPIAIFSAHALDLTLALYGPHHPVAVVVSHFSSLQDPLEITIQAFQACIVTIMADDNPSILTLRRIRSRLADFLEMSGSVSEAKNIRLGTLEGLAEPEDRDQDEWILSLADVAFHYLDHEPDRWDEVERLFLQIYDEGICPSTGEVDPCNTYFACHGLGDIARLKNNLDDVKWYLMQQIDVARQLWGGGDSRVLCVTEKLSCFLEDQERYDEAEQVRNSYQLVDDLEAMTLSPAFDSGAQLAI